MLIISQLKNCADIIVSKNNMTIVIEIKDGEKPISAQKLTTGELKFKEMWQGQYKIVNCIDHVIEINKNLGDVK